MRISQDTDSWHASGVLRRDFRHAHDEPETPPYRKTRRRVTPTHCAKAPSGVHETERYVSRETRRRVTVGEKDYTRVTTTWDYRCRYCHTHALAPKLLAPVADLLNDDDLSRLLEATWCHEGHLFGSFEEVSLYSWDRFHYTTRCVMCGKGSGWTRRQPQPSRELLRAADVSEELLDTANFGSRRLWSTSTVDSFVALPD